MVHATVALFLERSQKIARPLQKAAGAIPGAGQHCSRRLERAPKQLGWTVAAAGDLDQFPMRPRHLLDAGTPEGRDDKTHGARARVAVAGGVGTLWHVMAP